MSAGALAFRSHRDAREPAAVRWLPPRDGDPWTRFELTSRGDRVSGRLRQPPDGGPHPWVVVAAPDTTAWPDTPGLAVLTADLPLLGERASPKWTRRLRHCLADGPAGATDEALLHEFRSQAVADLRQLVAVGVGREDLARDRFGFAGTGAGAWVGAALRAAEPGPRAAVLAPGNLAEALCPREDLAASGAELILVEAEAEDRVAQWASCAGPDVRLERAAKDPLETALTILGRALA